MGGKEPGRCTRSKKNKRRGAPYGASYGDNCGSGHCGPLDPRRWFALRLPKSPGAVSPPPRDSCRRCFANVISAHLDNAHDLSRTALRGFLSVGRVCSRDAEMISACNSGCRTERLFFERRLRGSCRCRTLGPSWGQASWDGRPLIRSDDITRNASPAGGWWWLAVEPAKLIRESFHIDYSGASPTAYFCDLNHRDRNHTKRVALDRKPPSRTRNISFADPEPFSIESIEIGPAKAAGIANYTGALFTRQGMHCVGRLSEVFPVV